MFRSHLSCLTFELQREEANHVSNNDEDCNSRSLPRFGISLSA